MANAIEMETSERETLPETRLWRAVIARTIEEWVSGPLTHKREAERYIFDDSSDFRAVCQSAGLNPDFLRRQLSKYRNQPAVRTECQIAA